MKIVFAQATWRDDWEDTKKCILRLSPYVDEVIIVYDQTMTEKQVEELKSWGGPNPVRPVFHEFKDSLPDMRNAYLEEAKRRGADWVCVSDPDELYTEDLCKNLRRLIEENAVQGYNLLPVHCIDQFDNVEWLDELDKMKETPGGYRETSFWKVIQIFKLYHDTRYEGVGEQKNVHEQIISPSAPWISKNLPKEYSYIHKKSALRIWRNAARNMFIGGGGDNVGSINPYWPKLRDICTRLGITTWPSFEEHVTQPSVLLAEDQEFKDWLYDALQAPATNWGTETREMAKWYFMLHKQEVTLGILERIQHPPVMTKEVEVENYVVRTYFQVLGRHPDDEGRTSYTKQILDGVLKSEELPKILMQSQEYKLKVGTGVDTPAGPVEQVKLNVPIRVDVQVTEELFTEALRRSELLWTTIMPKMDIGNYVLKSLTPYSRARFIKGFYANKANMTPMEFTENFLGMLPKENSLAVCIMGYSKAVPLILQTIENVSLYLDAERGDEIWVQGDDFSEEDIKLLQGGGPKGRWANTPYVNVKIIPWEDEFSRYKNEAVASANTEWVVILDHDEIPTPEMAQTFKAIIWKSERGKLYNMVSFDVIDVETVKGEPVSENPNKSGKPLMHWNVPEPYYGNPHIWLRPNYYPWKLTHYDVAYRHVKDIDSILPNSVRNVFLGGGGDSVKEANPAWVELRKLTTELRIDTWKDFNAYLKKGKIDPKVLAVLKKLAEMPWKDSELKDPLRYYYRMHEEEEA